MRQKNTAVEMKSGTSHLWNSKANGKMNEQANIVAISPNSD